MGDHHRSSPSLGGLPFGVTDEGFKLIDAGLTKGHRGIVIFALALDRLVGIAPQDAIVVGGTPYDADAAGRIGLRTIGVRSGGFSDLDLRNAGCSSIYDDPADILLQYDKFLRDADGV